MTTTLPPTPIPANGVATSSNHDVQSNDDVETTSILVLYATETGTALDIAEQLAQEARRRLYDVRIASIDAYPIVRAPPLILMVSL